MAHLGNGVHWSWRPVVGVVLPLLCTTATRGNLSRGHGGIAKTFSLAEAGVALNVLVSRRYAGKVVPET